MRILLLNHNVRYNGTYYRAMPMAEQLAAREHQVTLLTVSPKRLLRPKWSTVNGVRLGEMPNLGQNFSGEGYGPLDNLLRLVHAVTRQYDIVHMLDHKPNATFAGFPARLKGAKLVADWVDWWGGPGGINDVPRRFPFVGHFEAIWEEKSKLWADGVVTISAVLMQRAIELGCAPEHVVYLPTGAAVGRIHPIPIENARRSLGIPVDRSIVGFIGMGQGDLEIVMGAVRDLHHVWLMVIGKTNPRVQRQAEEFGIANRVWQTGFVPDDQVSTYLACANVMCLPLTDSAANRGRLPNKLLDYMSAGRLTIANPIGDVAHIIRQHQIGFLAQDTKELTVVLDRVLRDRDLQKTMGIQARHVAETQYAWPALIQTLEQFYTSVLQL